MAEADVTSAIRNGKRELPSDACGCIGVGKWYAVQQVEQLVGIEVLGASHLFQDPESPQVEMKHLLAQVAA
jgi:hypothetical protein